MSKSKNMYSLLANNYSDYANTKKKYIKCVDDIVISSVKNSVSNYLDIGTGDGKRAINIANSVKAKHIVLSDSCEEMLGHIEKNNANEVILFDVTEKYCFDKKFDLITALWNVFGHIEDMKKRLVALNYIYDILEEQGRFYFDINNRYNIDNYGWSNVLMNFLKDINPLAADSGDFNFQISIKGESIPSFVHIHSPFEIFNLIKKTKFHLNKVYVIDYDDGSLKDSYFRGQLLFELIK